MATVADRAEGADDRMVVGVYRRRWRDLFVAGALVLAALFGLGDFTESGDWPIWSWRVPVIAIVGSVMVIRALRRGVVVSRAGIDSRSTFTGWRVPWAAVESCRADDPDAVDRRLTVTLNDGSTRESAIGRGRRDDPSFADAATVARRDPVVRKRSDHGPNWPLLAFMVSGLALIVAIACADAGRTNRQSLEGRAGLIAYEQRRQLGYEILAADVLSIVLGATTLASAVVALWWCRREGGEVPIGPWPAKLEFPRGDSGFDASPRPVGPADGGPPVPTQPGTELLYGTRDGVARSDGELVVAISHRMVPRTGTATHTYWYARGVAAFSVHVQTPVQVSLDRYGVPSGVTRWCLTSWTSPVPLSLEEGPCGGNLVVRSGGAVVGYVREVVADATATWYLAIDNAQRVVATIARCERGWRCAVAAERERNTLRLLLVAMTWAGERPAAKPSTS